MASLVDAGMRIPRADCQGERARVLEWAEEKVTCAAGRNSPGGSGNWEMEEELIEKCSGKWPPVRRPCGAASDTAPAGSA